MLALIKEYAKPIGLVIAGVFGAKLLEKGLTSAWNAVPKSLPQANTGTPAPQAPPAPTPTTTA